MSFQGCQWAVGFGHYCIVGDSLTYNFQDTILTLGIIGFVVKIVKDKHKFQTLSFNVQMLLHILLSLNYLILP